LATSVATVVIPTPLDDKITEVKSELSTAPINGLVFELVRVTLVVWVTGVTVTMIEASYPPNVGDDALTS
jgi:hypothetical protein